jgi:hypothetical protein
VAGATISARGVAEAALAAMGGVEKLAHVKEIRYRSVGQLFHFEQSVRPEGPWIATTLKTQESVAFAVL